MGRLRHTPAELIGFVHGFTSSKYPEAYARRLRRLIDVARSAGIQPVFVTQPLLVGPAIDDLTGVDLSTLRIGGAVNGEFTWARQEAYNDVTRRVCRESGVPLVDLARRMPKSTRYFYDLMHYTNDGAALVAEIVARDLCPMIARRYPEFVVGDCAAVGNSIAPAAR